MIEILSNEFNWRLCTVFFLLGHVEIVYEDDALLTDRRSEDTLTPLFEFGVDSILSLISRCLCTECEGNVLICFGKTRREERVCVERFTSTCWSREADVEVISEEKFHEVDVSCGIIRRDHDFIVDKFIYSEIFEILTP